MKPTGEPGKVGALAEEAVVAACTLADAADPSRWSAGAVEDVAAALEVLAGALAQLVSAPAMAGLLGTTRRFGMYAKASSS
ncbi:MULTISPECIES: hypothetical protein [Streptomyces]|uniref:Uncharacterized protein n=1 Tax=Streptomyces eurythermus TaxID=42237 RepID=A0ABW6Z8X7_9ACTN|nr:MULTISPECIES: hypothetical protein [Streptomyces]QIS68659.1 hypothetical protein HB370_00165 [Streptomyces sp. DSM 40868]